MSAMWYCRSCGYEVERGGRCHNCRQHLVAGLEELAADEDDDEVGYRLDGWADEARGALIEALVSQEIRHRFEGDELVVAADDEEAVDDLVGVGGEREGDAATEPDDEATLAAVEALYDAAVRLRQDPTDMHADGDLAEASIGVFGIERLYGVDDDAWAAVGRVTRRLLGALGADEALEQEIATDSAVLCRLLEPIVAPQEDRATPWVEQPPLGLPHLEDDDAGFAPPTFPAFDADADADADADGDADADTEVEALDADPAARVADSERELVYALDQWLLEERTELTLYLEAAGIAHAWEGAELVIDEQDDAVVGPLLDRVDRSGSGVLPSAPEGADDEDRYHVISNLFGAADRLAGDPDDTGKRYDLSSCAEAIEGWATPLGLTDQQWRQISIQAGDLRAAIDGDADSPEVRDGAARLRDLLRAFV